MARSAVRAWCAGLVIVALGCADPAASSRAEVVYGTDDRTEVYAHPSAALRAVAESAIAVKIRHRYVDESDPADVQIDYTRTLSEAQDLCPGQRFEDQIEPGSCSGTLIDSQHILTAGHCMDEPSDCDDYSWLLGFRYAAADTLATLTSDDVYRCDAVVAYLETDDVDYALVRLARPVVGHTPVNVRAETSALPSGTPIAMIGHPHGLPMKIDDGGSVTWSSADASHFQATVDAFPGNSGSGTFDLDGNLVGLLDSGEDDYVDMGGCNVVNVIDPPPTDDGEGLTYLRPALDAFCAVLGLVSPVCDCGGGACVEVSDHDRCDDAEVIAAESQVIEGTLVRHTPTEVGTCGGDGPERVYTFTLTEPARLVATSEGFDSVLYLRADTCNGRELDCDDDIDPDTNTGSLVSSGLLPGTYFLFLDAYDLDVGAFTLTLEFTERGFDAGGPPDAGPPDTPDSGAEADAGDASPPASGGCVVTRVTNERSSGALVLLLALWLAARRRRS